MLSLSNRKILSVLTKAILVCSIGLFGCLEKSEEPDDSTSNQTAIDSSPVVKGATGDKGPTGERGPTGDKDLPGVRGELGDAYVILRIGTTFGVGSTLHMYTIVAQTVQVQHTWHEDHLILVLTF